MLEGKDYRLIRTKREALIYYLTSCYFPAFKRARHHVLYTIPFTDNTTTTKHGITAVKFQIVPFMYGAPGVYAEGLIGPQKALFERNMIVLAGMIDGHKLPESPLPRPQSGASGNWVCGVGREVPHGTVCVSRATFLNTRVLALLEKVNAETTILPAFSGVEDGDWVLALTTWSNHQMKKARTCKWKEVTRAHSESLDFEWRNRDNWRYQHDGDFGGNGLYSVDCK